MRTPLLREVIAQPQDPSYRYIPLTQGQFAIVDAGDYEFLSQWSWCVTKKTSGFYAQRRGPEGLTYMHRQILEVGADMVVDHVDRDTLNNRRSNLRGANKSLNAQNSKMNKRNRSGLKGVSWSTGMKAWCAQICRDGKTRYLGCYRTPEEAHQAYLRESGRHDELVIALHDGLGDRHTGR